MNPKKLYPVILAISIVFFAWSCSKEKETNTPPTADIVISDNLDEIVLSSTASDPDGDPLTYRWSTNSSQVLLANSSKEETYFKKLIFPFHSSWIIFNWNTGNKAKKF